MRFSLQSSDDVAEVLSQRLRAVRLHKNLRQLDLAKMAGVSIGAVRTLERDGQTSMSTFIRVVQALGLVRELEPLFEQRPMSIAALERMAATEDRQRARPAQRTVHPDKHTTDE